MQLHNLPKMGFNISASLITRIIMHVFMRLTACLFMLCSVCFHFVSFVLDCLCSFVPNSQLTMDVQSGLCSAKPLTDLRTVSLQVEAFSAREDDLGEFVSNHVFPLTHKHSYSKTFFTSC